MTAQARLEAALADLRGDNIRIQFQDYRVRDTVTSAIMALDCALVMQRDIDAGKSSVIENDPGVYRRKD